MKRIITILVLSATIAANAFGQNAKEIYNAYSGKEGVSTVYISPMMFRMLGALPDLQVEDQNIKLIAESLTEFYLIHCQKAELAPKLTRDAEEILKRKKLELLMEAAEGSERVRIYVREEGDFYLDFVMVESEPSETTLILFTGKLRKESLAALIGKNL